MGQLLRAMTYDRDSEDGVEALSIASTPLVWAHLDDGVMGGKSATNLTAQDDKKLIFQGSIDTNACVGWASVRARLPEGGLPEYSESLVVSYQGDGKTYKVLLMDANHDSRGRKQSPLWEANLPTTKAQVETTTLPLDKFIPSFMARQLTPEERSQHTLEPSQLTKIGIMLSSRLSDGSTNPVETYGKGTFGFSLRVDSLKVGAKPEKSPAK